MPQDCREEHKCSSNKICNTKTGRCVKKQGKIGKTILNMKNKSPVIQPQQNPIKSPCKKLCDPDKICNDKTKRCVQRSGKIGKSILEEQKIPVIPISKISISPKPVKSPCKKLCKSNEICNPKSGRCVSRNGKIGKSIITDHDKAVLPLLPIPTNIPTAPLIQIPEPSIMVRPTSLIPIQDQLVPIDQIIGPVSLTHLYSGKYSKNIYLFGDQHVFDATCPFEDNKYQHKSNIDEFMKNTILANPDKIIDVYLELAFISEKYPVRNPIGKSFLELVNTSFDNCAQIKKTLCPYPNVRVHYTNIRKTIPKIKDLNWMYHLSKALPIKPLNKDYITFIKAKIPNNVESIFPLNLSELLYSSKITKQLNSIKDLYIKKTLTDYIVNEMRVNMPTLNDWISLRDETGNFETIGKRLIQFLNALMDGYLLARMFRSYQNIRNGKPSDDSKFNFIYVGENHAKNYIHILVGKLLFNMPTAPTASYIKNKDFQCISVKQYSQPFFKIPVENKPFMEYAQTKYGKEALNFILPNYKIVSELGSGVFGTAYLTSDSNFNQEVLKYTLITKQTTIKSVQHEFEMLRNFSEVGLSPNPRMINFYKSQNKEVGVIAMERVYGTIAWLLDHYMMNFDDMNILSREIDRLLTTMCKYDFIHGDFHFGNIGYNLTAAGMKLMIIDLGFACCLKTSVRCNPTFELSKLLENCYKWVNFRDASSTLKINLAFIIGMIKRLMKKWNIPENKIPATYDEARILFVELNEKHHKMLRKDI